MKLILLACCVVLAIACQQRNFSLEKKGFSYYDRTSEDTLLKKFQDGVYVLKICNQKTKTDGHLITTFESCPDSALTAENMDKTIYLVFFEGNRVMYISGRMFMSTKQGILRANKLSSFRFDLHSLKNRDRQLLRGYYYVEPVQAEHGADSIYTVYMQLEKFKRKLVYLKFQLQLLADGRGQRLLMEEAGISEKEEYDLHDNGPVMKELDSIFHTKLEFFFCDTIRPNLYSKDPAVPLWPDDRPQVNTAVKSVNEALRW